MFAQRKLGLEHLTPQPAQHELVDLRFRTLLGPYEWKQLPEATQRRFSKRVNNGKAVVYKGRITKVRLSKAGRLLANILKPFGAPLPLSDEINVPSIVTVTEDGVTGGQNWTRLYANTTDFPQVIHSAKRFSGKTGLEEYIGFGIHMALKVRVEDGVLIFENDGYNWSVFGQILPIPKFLHPGNLTVTHADKGKGQFEFGLTLQHPVFGRLVEQVGLYHEETR